MTTMTIMESTEILQTTPVLPNPQKIRPVQSKSTENKQQSVLILPEKSTSLGLSERRNIPASLKLHTEVS